MNNNTTTNNETNQDGETKKLILWEGFKKELPWILFWIAIGIMAYGYYQDKEICNQVLADPCEACYRLNQTIQNDLNCSQIGISCYEDISIDPRLVDTIGADNTNPITKKTILNYEEQANLDE